MKKTYLCLLCCITMALSASLTYAQDSSIGLGVGLRTGSLAESGFNELFSPVSIYLPLTLSGIRIEPELGLFRVSASDDDSEATVTVIQLGTGIFVVTPTGDANLYFGGRVGITRGTDAFEFDGDREEESITNLFLGPALGVEYFFDDQFSLGGEAQVIYTRLGEEDDGNDDNDVTASVIQTNGVFFIRWYF